MSTIERLIPDELAPDDITGKVTLDLHLDRYEFAARHARPGRLLDIACGVGYGTHLMAAKASGVIEAIGVDISPEAIAYARQRYAGRLVQFLQHDAMTFTDPKGFASVVSIETVEHVPDPAGLISHLVGLLQPDGVLVASVPVTPSVDANPYHLHDFTGRSFRKLAAAHNLKEIASMSQVQPYPLVRTLKRQESRMEDLRPNMVTYYFRHPPAFFKRLWSTLRYGFTNRYLTIVWQKAG